MVELFPPQIISQNGLMIIYTHSYTEAYGGPDTAANNFTPVQKAINFAMTPFFTTGGIRGKAKSLEKFHPRSFNMGISKEVFDKTGGFSDIALR